MKNYDFPFDFDDPHMAALLEDTPFWSARFGMMMMSHLPLAPNMQILDLACGTGFPLFQLASMFGPSSHITGLDIWKEGLNHAEKRRAHFGIENVSLVHLDGDHYPFPDDHFDWVVSNLGVNNFDNPQSALAECARVLKPDGRIAITTNLTGHMQAFYTVFRAVLKDHKNQTYLQRLTAHEAHRGTVKSHANLLSSAGFIGEKAVEDQFILRFLDGSALFSYPLIRFAFMPAWLGIIDEDEQDSIMEAVENRLNEVATVDGEIRLSIPMLYLQGRLNDINSG
ncbi:MAG: class I SAM-dependent methyltransferase [Aggregatilineales bacterium]